MASAGLAAAISLSAIFGAVLLWILVYYAYRYIRECASRNSTNWLHIFALPEDFGRERADTPRASEEDGRGGSQEEEQRGRDKRRADFEKQDSAREARRREKVRNKVDEWEDGKSAGENASDVSKSVEPRERRDRSSRHEALGEVTERVLLQPYPYVPAYLPAFVPLAQPYVPQFVPLALGSAILPGHVQNIEVEEDTTQEEYPYVHTLEPAYEEDQSAASEQYEPDDSVEGSSSQHSVATPKAANEPLREDFIEICDEYPEFVKNHVEREQRRKDRENTNFDSDDGSSSSDTSSTTVEEVPRAYIPTATQRPPFEFPEHPQLPFRKNPRLIPRSYPRQW